MYGSCINRLGDIGTPDGRLALAFAVAFCWFLNAWAGT